MAELVQRAVRIAAMLSCGVAASLAVAAAGTQYAYDRPGDKRFVNNTAVLERASAAGNNHCEKIVAPRARVNAAFTRQPVIVDGAREAAWDAAASYPIANTFNADMTAGAPDAATRGTLRLLWDGPVLLLGRLQHHHRWPQRPHRHRWLVLLQVSALNTGHGPRRHRHGVF